MKKTSTFLTSFGIGLAILSTGLVHAAEPPKETPASDSKITTRFEKADTDDNGLISLEEYKAYSVQRAEKNAAFKFPQVDTDKNGSISREEFNLHHNRAADDSKFANYFKKIDTDDNESISLEEFQANAFQQAKINSEKNFTKFDADQSQTLTLEEFSASEAPTARKQEQKQE